MPLEALTAFEGRSEDAVLQEAAGDGRVLARWEDAGVPQTVEYTAPSSERLAGFPSLPERMVANPDRLLRALDDAAHTTAADSARFALQRLQLRGGQRGEIVATDGRQLLLQGGFAFPWDGDVLVPRVMAFGCRELQEEGTIEVGKTDEHVMLRVGAWTFALRIDTEARFPDIAGIIPRPRADSTRWQINAEDAAYLARILPRLPGAGEVSSPMTLELADPVVLRARADGQTRITEVVLARSSCTGKPVRVCLNRELLARLLSLGFREVQVIQPEAPLLCREEQRTYLCVPLGHQAALGPGEDALRLVSSDSAPIPPTSVPERRSSMPPSNANIPPARNGTPPPADPSPVPNGIEPLIEEAESLRTALAEAHTRAGRLASALKQQRRQGRALAAALHSLRTTLQP